MPTIDLTDDELAAVAAANPGAIEEDRFTRAPRLDRSARRWQSSARQRRRRYGGY